MSRNPFPLCSLLAALVLSSCATETTTFRGRIIDTSGAPIKTAEVRAISYPRFSPFGPSFRIHAESQTDAHGAFTLVVPGHGFMVEVEHHGHTAYWSRWKPDTDSRFVFRKVSVPVREEHSNGRSEMASMTTYVVEPQN
jgi:hypothetical protein